MIAYADIQKANEGLTAIDFKGKDYVMVPQRVKAFRKLFPDGFILTDIIQMDSGVVVMQAKAGYYTENGSPVVLGSGYAFERQDSSYINKTSYIENCETSAVGRALGFLALGIDGGGICSAEELANAVANQNRGDEKPKAEKVAPNAQVTTTNKMPEAKKAEKELSPEMAFLNNELGFMAQESGSTMDGMKAAYMVSIKAMVKAKLIPDKKVSEYTKDEIEKILDYMRTSRKVS